MADNITLLSAIVTTCTTVVLAVLTWRYVRLTQQMAQIMESAREPFVDIELDMPDHELRLAFINGGGTTAREITFSVEKDCEHIQGIRRNGEKGIASMHPIENGISYLPSNQRLIYSAGRCNNLKSAEDTNLIIRITYTNDPGRRFFRTVRYDLKQIEHVLFESFQNDLVGVAKSIREAERSMARNQAGSPFKHVGMSKCPSCCQMISDSAKKCHYCHEWVSEIDSEIEGEAPSA